MKRIILILLVVSIGGAASAQQITSNKGYPVLPEKGDWSIGFDAIPFFHFIGNLFNDSTNNGPSAEFKKNHPYTISGLLVKDEKTAYRAVVRIGINSNKSDSLVQRLGSTNVNETVADETKTGNNKIVLGVGFQKWKGRTRLKGIYGAEALLSISTNKTSYTYGNPLSNENQIQNRLKSQKEGTGIGFQIRGFIGVEYFFAPKMSVSAEYGWGPSINSIGSGEVQTESWNGSGVDSNITKTGKSSSFGFDVDNAGGAINFNFYF